MTKLYRLPHLYIIVSVFLLDVYKRQPQLYDMKQAGEKVNLATEHPEKVFELQQILRKVRNKSIQMK